jgi:hypothetical protein
VRRRAGPPPPDGGRLTNPGFLGQIRLVYDQIRPKNGSEVQPESWSATKDATHDSAEFQLIVISLVDHDSMSSM